MGWNLAAADLPQEARNYLSCLGSCGDEAQAAEEADVLAADIRRWSALDEFISHRAQAMQYFDSWRGYAPPRSPYTTATDPYAVDPAHAYGSPGGL